MEDLNTKPLTYLYLMTLCLRAQLIEFGICYSEKSSNVFHSALFMSMSISESCHLTLTARGSPKFIAMRAHLVVAA